MEGQDKEAATSKKASEFAADVPVDLATFYASKGGVDLSTLSEITKSVGVSEKLDNSRSKRTCVRVREEISKLEEIFKDDSTIKASVPSKSRGGRGKGRGSSARASSGTSQLIDAEVACDEVGGVVPSVKKYKRPAYSQFTHKRRKRKRKLPEEGIFTGGREEVMVGIVGCRKGGVISGR